METKGFEHWLPYILVGVVSHIPTRIHRWYVLGERPSIFEHQGSHYPSQVIVNLMSSLHVDGMMETLWTLFFFDSQHDDDLP